MAKPRLRDFLTRSGHKMDAHRMIAVGLLALTIGLVGCATTSQSDPTTTTSAEITGTENTSPPADTSGPEIVDLDDAARCQDRGKDPAVVCHWAS